MSGKSFSIIEPGSRESLIEWRIESVRRQVRAKYQPRFSRASSSAEKEALRKEMNEEMRKAIEAEDSFDYDPHCLY